jgi:S-DNA-T family DNA segregation ATPase FtsK/SpoIIIE
LDKDNSNGTLTGFQRILEAGLILSAALSVFLLLALLSFDGADPSWSQTGNPNQVQNHMGTVGAWAADVLLFFLGWISYVVPVAIIALGWLLFKKIRKLLEIDYLTLGLRLIGMMLIILSTTAITSINFDDLYHFSSGGVVGDVIRDTMVPFFNYTGTTLLLLSFLFTGLTLFTGISWLTVIDGVGAGAVGLYQWLMGRFDKNRAKREENAAESSDQVEEIELDDKLAVVPEMKAVTTAAQSSPWGGAADTPVAEEPVPETAPEPLSTPPSSSPSIADSMPDYVAPDEPARPVVTPAPAPISAQRLEPQLGISLKDVVIEEEPDFVDFENLMDEPLSFSAVDEPAMDDDIASALEKLQRTSNLQDETEVEHTILPNEPLVDAYGPASDDEAEEPLTGFAAVMATAKEDIGDFPTIELLDRADKKTNPITQEDMDRVSRLVEAKLLDFNIIACVVGVYPGPVITSFELDLAPGIKVSKIVGLAKDLARALSAVSVRVVEVIPGKTFIGLELPNKHREIVRLSEVINCPAFVNSESPLAMVLGQDISGRPVTVDLGKMPHLLVAGTTGSGKSVGVNTMIISLLYKSKPEDVRMIMIDPKMLELSVYEGIPHLLTEVVTDMKEAGNALRWCVGEMERRYKLMSALGVRNLKGYNTKVLKAKADGKPIKDPLWKDTDGIEEVAPDLDKLPSIVVIIDEFADMMMIVGKICEEMIARIAQKARAAGIHLLLATQRPSVDVITGLIKANIPTRMAFQVSSKIDSRTILDQGGAEALLGMGDMLYLPPGTSVPTRVHGAFVDDHEVHAVVNNWKRRQKPDYIKDILSDEGSEEVLLPGEQAQSDEDSDEFYDQAVAFVTETRRASVSSVQRKFRIGYNRAARIVEQMEAVGVISPPGHNGNREVLAAPPPKVDV